MKAKPTKNTKLRNTIFIYVFLPFLSVVLYSFNQNTGSTSRPNIVFILADDQGWRDLGYMGSKYYETPEIDRLAASGMVFTNAYANAPNCAPTRAALMTGLYAPRTGIYTVGSSERGKAALRRLIPVENKTVLDTAFITIAEALHANGYVCASIGKWHLGDPPGFGPGAQGFDLNVAGWHLGHPRSYFSPYHNPYLPDGPKGEYLTDRLTAEAEKFIEANKDRPFFLYFPHYAVHTPLQAKDSLTGIFRQRPPDDGQRNAVYAAMIKSLDESVGRILRRLDSLHLRENTLVIFMSDNGGVWGITSNAPLRGAKGMLYEGGIREPFIASWPGHIAAGSRSDYPIIGLDLYPTLLEITGTPTPKGFRPDGIDLSDLFLDGKEPRRRILCWHFPAYLERMRGMPQMWRTTPATALRYGDWKLIRFYETGKEELYNLKEDIGEKNDLSLQDTRQKKKMSKKMDRWLRKTHAPLPLQKNPAFDEKAYQQQLEKIKAQTHEKN